MQHLLALLLAFNSFAFKPEAPELKVEKMKVFSDEKFQFSFWLPEAWTVKEAAIVNPQMYGGGLVKRCYEVYRDLEHPLISIEVFFSKTRVIADSTGVGACSTCIGVTYAYGPRDKWVRTYTSSGSHPGGSSKTAEVDASANSMGGFPLLPGSHMAEGNTIVPLTEHKFLIVSAIGNEANQKLLAATISGIGRGAGKTSGKPETYILKEKHGILSHLK
jgi:hypothetical protein